jgi:4-hydroxy-tetrahydrodipicolinate reductase
VLYGLGPIGCLIAKKALERSGIDILGGIEVDANKVDKDLGEVLGIQNLGVPVVHDDYAVEFLSRVKPDVAILTTGTYLDRIYPQIMKCIETGTNVLSTSETLAYPWYRYPDLSDYIDREARRKNVTVLGTGVNPGFIFDSLLAILTSACTRIDSIKAVRSINASRRRDAFQRKIGLGLSVSEFERMYKENRITGHVGYVESIMLLSSIMNIRLDRVNEGQEPVIAEKPMKTRYFDIEKGCVCGIRGIGVGYLGEKEFIRLEFIAIVDGVDYDEIVIEGEPPQEWRNKPGLYGDLATAGMILNMIPKMLNTRKGIITMKDVTIPSISHEVMGVHDQ